MRKDVRIGMLIGTGVCIGAVVWLCTHQHIVEQSTVDDLMAQNKDLFSITPKQEVNVPQVSVDATTKNTIEPRQDFQNSPPAVVEKTEPARIHTVLPGQTLSDISKIYYGNAGEWKKIYEANKELLPRGPDTIRIGMKLIIP